MQMCASCLRLHSHIYSCTDAYWAFTIREQTPTHTHTQALEHTSPSLFFSPSLQLSEHVNTRGGKKQRAHCLHLLIRASLFRSLSPSADLNYTSFYQASQGSTPAAALFIKCTVRIHTSKLMRESRAVNQTWGLARQISGDGGHK